MQCIKAEERRKKEVEVTKPSEYLTKNSVNRRLNIMQLNIDSLKSKVVELRHFLKEQDIDVFMLQETKLLKKDKLPRIPGYTLVRDDRQPKKGKTKGRGGGLLTGVRDNIPFKEVKLGKPGIRDKITEWQTIDTRLRIKNSLELQMCMCPH